MAGELRNGDPPTGKQIAAHLQMVFASVPKMVKTLLARADSGFYCWDAVEAYESVKCGFIIVARKTARLVEQVKAAEWQRSPGTDADGQCEFWYQPDGWGKAYRFLALRYEKKRKAGGVDTPDQYQLFETPQYIYRLCRSAPHGQSARIAPDRVAVYNLTRSGGVPNEGPVYHLFFWSVWGAGPAGVGSSCVIDHLGRHRNRQFWRCGSGRQGGCCAGRHQSRL